MQPVAKDWGVVRYIHRGPHTEVHHTSIRKGGVSSVGAMHRHLAKHNDFYVVLGCLFIHTGGSVRTLHAGEHCSIPPGVWHRFEALTDVELIEIYYLSPIDTGDIERGGGESSRRHPCPPA